VRAYATRMLPILEEHLRTTRDLADEHRLASVSPLTH
jgi:hypothetical protein